MHEAELERDFWPDDAAPQHPVERACQADESRHALRAASAWNDAGAHLGVSVPEVPSLTDSQVAGEGQLESASHCVSVHRGDDHFRQRRHLIEDRLVAADEWSCVSGQGRIAR